MSETLPSMSEPVNEIPQANFLQVMPQVASNGQGQNQVPLPERKIVVLGFADSRVQAPFADPSWEIWGCNDVYAHVPRVDVTFEVHHLLNLGNRRNPNHETFLRSGSKPVWMIEPPAEFPAARRLPTEEILKTFPRAYFTNSISYMIAMAIMDILGQASWQPRNHRVPGKIAIYGVDMAAQSEYGSQRPSCEYFVGVAEGLGIEVFIPENSDLCKTTALYGAATTAPLRVKCQSRIEHLRAAKVQLMGQQQQKQAEMAAIQSQLDQVRGQMAAYEYVSGVWTMPTDVQIGAVLPEKDRSLSSDPLVLADLPLPVIEKEASPSLT